MAKRRTLRRQRDKALAELKSIKELRQPHAIMNSRSIERRVNRIQGHLYSSECELKKQSEEDVIRKILHDIVDKGLLDGLVHKSAEVNACSRQLQIKHQIAIDVIVPERVYEDEFYSQMWGWRDRYI